MIRMRTERHTNWLLDYTRQLHTIKLSREDRRLATLLLLLLLLCWSLMLMYCEKELVKASIMKDTDSHSPRQSAVGKKKMAPSAQEDAVSYRMSALVELQRKRLVSACKELAVHGPRQRSLVRRCRGQTWRPGLSKTPSLTHSCLL